MPRVFPPRLLALLPLTLAALLPQPGGGGHAAASTPPVAPAPFAPAEEINIAAPHSGKCLETATGAAGDPVRQGRCFGKPTALWYLTVSPVAHDAVRIVSATSGLCMGVEGTDPASGAAVRQGNCSEPGADFRIAEAAGGVRLRTVAGSTPKCLEVTDASVKDSAPVRLGDCADRPGSLFAQQHPPRHRSTTLVNVNSGKCLGIVAQGQRDGMRAVQRTCSGAADEKWRVVDLNDGTVAAYNTNSGKCLGTNHGSLDSGADAEQYSCEGLRFQIWTLRKGTVGGADGYTLANVRSGKYLGIRGRSADDNAMGEQSDLTGGAEQLWRLDLPS